MAYTDLIRERFFPHIWCPGCGHGVVLNSLLHVVDELGLDPRSMCMISGIGCSARISGYVNFHTMHTMHGRALPCATGIKMSKPELNVIVPMGDGDAMAIGGNHFIHACRRNIDLTAIVLNNRIYGMTGGQYSPLSGRGILATTAPYGSIDNDFDTVSLAKGAGASFVARTTAFHVKEMAKILKKAINHKGFSAVEVMVQCPTYFGRKNKMGGAIDLLKSYRDNTAPLGSKKLEENPELIPRGIFVDEERPEYCEEYANVIAQANEE
ncbi:2-oxoacid:ferredoxin oxidoreductase subunit beta [Pseudodesulfovibrio sp. JC047]|uniref:2-oxoacid:ferredoxin oxidoreductase subunit beta n=1 Tax=Pseudodesulfovibrio sp. JC047 TaxID=2683199 RepID=UPI0013D45D86|nr:2-oxoacid:ferredoxin oxidoreductase subunit beta [Pseudodesulfovibrio sp. JC047]NDV18379.1 2-oxoacid:ferredoxin oxidoreductase subunit beta [Pseudodesulfovibrio sp. JC047]